MLLDNVVKAKQIVNKYPEVFEKDALVETFSKVQLNHAWGRIFKQCFFNGDIF